ncbi:uncharacterized protein CLUP02_06155 [Colletotrichum lupini]|uniref:Secreted protein n=1 Tax=Colletotrichum lupini TaxID=145971 RepID=A0A9Q8SNM8_9PEZI|nr:uncharacterized protein CLUP02_06155 [Colletotrichum lupini]UQC80671.1 hypothetical protein CLUP02_06155 [Colletotrichum lupini]
MLCVSCFGTSARLSALLLAVGCLLLLDRFAAPTQALLGGADSRPTQCHFSYCRIALVLVTNLWKSARGEACFALRYWEFNPQSSQHKARNLSPSGLASPDVTRPDRARILETNAGVRDLGMILPLATVVVRATLTSRNPNSEASGEVSFANTYDLLCLDVEVYVSQPPVVLCFSNCKKDRHAVDILLSFVVVAIEPSACYGGFLLSLGPGLFIKMMVMQLTSHAMRLNSATRDHLPEFLVMLCDITRCHLH